MIPRKTLQDLYFQKNMSMQEVADHLKVSPNKVHYWMDKYGLDRRSISAGVYLKNNPNGDPFKIRTLKTSSDLFLFGLGLGLYWGEGTKSNKTSIRLGNTDPNLIKKFIEFLEHCYCIDKNKLKFGLQIFTDMSTKKALSFWKKHLNISTSQFQKVVVTGAQSIGTYRNKTKYGVLTVYFNNKKLRNILCGAIENL